MRVSAPPERVVAPAEGTRQRVLLIHTGETPELDLLDWAAMFGGGEATVAAYPSDAVLSSLAHAARSRFELRGLPAPNLRTLAETDVDAVLETARETRAELLVMRHPAAFDKPRALARRILHESPCSVCLVPSNAPPRVERILAGIRTDDSGHNVLSQAASLYHAAQAEELLAVHSCFYEIFDGDQVMYERFCSERTLELYRFMAGVRLPGVSCTPVLAEGAAPHRVLAREASGRAADLVVVGRQLGTPARISTELLKVCPLPLVQVLLPHPGDGMRGRLRRFFSNPEPKFG